MASPNGEGPASVYGDAKNPVPIIIPELADDGVAVPVPEYADEDDDRLPANAWAGSKAHMTELMKCDVACFITEFKDDLKEFIQEYFDPNEEDQVVRLLRVQELLDRPADDPARTMLGLLSAALDDGNVPADTYEAAAASENKEPDGAVDEEYEYPEKPVSEVGFVSRVFMRMCIKAFFYPNIDVDDESKDTNEARHLWANFMSATGFVNRLHDVRRIVRVFFDHDLDQETRKATMLGMMRELEELLKARANAVSTGRFKLV